MKLSLIAGSLALAGAQAEGIVMHPTRCIVVGPCRDQCVPYGTVMVEDMFKKHAICIPGDDTKCYQNREIAICAPDNGGNCKWLKNDLLENCLSGDDASKTSEIFSYQTTLTIQPSSSSRPSLTVRPPVHTSSSLPVYPTLTMRPPTPSSSTLNPDIPSEHPIKPSSTSHPTLTARPPVKSSSTSTTAEPTETNIISAAVGPRIALNGALQLSLLALAGAGFVILA